MSYDLIFRGPPDPASEAAKVAERYACSHHATDGGIGIQLQLGDEQVAKLYGAIVKLAKKHGATLHDPQLGADVDLAKPGRFPPMWGPSGPVYGKSFPVKVKSFLLDHLRPHGFVPQTAWTATRDGDHLIEGVNFQPGRGSLSGRFTVNIYRTFTVRPLDVPEAMHATTRLDELLVERGVIAPDGRFGGWLPSTPAAKLERSFEITREVFAETVLPMLDELGSVDAVVAAFEAGRLELRRAFGAHNPARNMADCYRHVGRIEDGRRLYQEYLATFEGRDDPHLARWLVGERERAAEHFG